jgi:hypothetical protein
MVEIIPCIASAYVVDTDPFQAQNSVSYVVAQHNLSAPCGLAAVRANFLGFVAAKLRLVCLSFHVGWRILIFVIPANAPSGIEISRRKATADSVGLIRISGQPTSSPKMRTVGIAVPAPTSSTTGNASRASQVSNRARRLSVPVEIQS